MLHGTYSVFYISQLFIDDVSIILRKGNIEQCRFNIIDGT